MRTSLLLACTLSSALAATASWPAFAGDCGCDANHASCGCQSQIAGNSAHTCCRRPIYAPVHLHYRHRHHFCAAPPEGAVVGFAPATAPATFAVPSVAATFATPVSYTPQSVVPMTTFAMPVAATSSFPSSAAPLPASLLLPRAASPQNDLDPELLRIVANALQSRRAAAAPSISCSQASGAKSAPETKKAPLAAPVPMPDKSLEERVEALEQGLVDVKDIILRIEKRVDELEKK